MKEKNKKLLILGGAGAVALYILSQKEESAPGVGGGGGFGIPPLLPGETPSMLPDNDNGSSTITYNIPSPPALSGFFSGMGAEEAAAPVTKKENLLQTYEKLYAPAQQAYEKSLAVGAPTASDVAAFAKTKKEESKKEGRPWWNPFSWDREDAIENYQAYVDRSWGLKEKTGFFGGGESRGKGFGGSWDVVHQENVHKTVVTKKKAAAASKRRQYGGYSRMAEGTSHAPGWKQMGYRRPTAPGQPDRY
jgi:hypothetical protein